MFFPQIFDRDITLVRATCHATMFRCRLGIECCTFLLSVYTFNTFVVTDFERSYLVYFYNHVGTTYRQLEKDFEDK